MLGFAFVVELVSMFHAELVEADPAFHQRLQVAAGHLARRQLASSVVRGNAFHKKINQVCFKSKFNDLEVVIQSFKPPSTWTFSEHDFVESKHGNKI